ncbi:hemerythrin domain-containing protein [Paludibaculum fermentans]|uniref:Hemerythrin domain-containing protein n=1 Tax=Paludibaculum fermentans TaxID=1473598 RepID=A0A7S7NTR3_PALFE|nr:hemerythrin domain-containing protein [Paludibaculum fermentans]QOY89578.1 hemerythrin domain-containing protein [Paludibaculum fermentans]
MSALVQNLHLDLIELLLGEHAAILALFRSLEQRLPEMGLREMQGAGYSVEALLMAHAIEEDALLFHSLPEKRDSVKRTLDAMFGEHNEQRRLMEELRSAKTTQAVRKLLSQVMELTREHFAVEERVLFELARKVLGKRKLEELGSEFARRRGLSTV